MGLHWYGLARLLWLPHQPRRCGNHKPECYHWLPRGREATQLLSHALPLFRCVLHAGTFDRDNGGSFLTDHFPCATKACWDFEGIYATSRHIPGVGAHELALCACIISRLCCLAVFPEVVSPAQAPARRLCTVVFQHTCCSCCQVYRHPCRQAGDSWQPVCPCLMAGSARCASRVSSTQASSAQPQARSCWRSGTPGRRLLWMRGRRPSAWVLCCTRDLWVSQLLSLNMHGLA